MKRISFLLLFLAIFMRLFSEETNFIIAEGLSGIGKDIGRSRDEALWDAQRNSIKFKVEEVMNADIISNKLSRTKDELLAQSNLYIDTYEILSEGKSKSVDGMYFIKIKAFIKKSVLLKKMLDLGLLTKLGDPKLMIIVDETYFEKKELHSVAEDLLIKEFSDNNYRIIQKNQYEKLLKSSNEDLKGLSTESKVLQIGKKLNVDFVIIGYAKIDMNESKKNNVNKKDKILSSFLNSMVGTIAYLNVKIIDANESQILKSVYAEHAGVGNSKIQSGRESLHKCLNSIISGGFIDLDKNKKNTPLLKLFTEVLIKKDIKNK